MGGRARPQDVAAQAWGGATRSPAGGAAREGAGEGGPVQQCALSDPGREATLPKPGRTRTNNEMGTHIDAPSRARPRASARRPRRRRQAGRPSQSTKQKAATPACLIRGCGCCSRIEVQEAALRGRIWRGHTHAAVVHAPVWHATCVRTGGRCSMAPPEDVIVEVVEVVWTTLTTTTTPVGCCCCCRRRLTGQ